MCDSNCGKGSERFTITRGVTNQFIFVIKQDRSTLPIAIRPTDTFVAHLMKYSAGAPIRVNTTTMTVGNAASGQVILTYPKELTETFTTEKGGAEDRFYLRPIHYLLLECSTEANGDFIAKKDKVYVD